LAKHGLHPQFWISVPAIAANAAATPAERVRLAAEKLLPRVRQAAAMGSSIGLYNHGGWAGEPETMVAVLRELRDRHGATNVGIVYNSHHGHDHLERFAECFALMQPYLLCVNLSGMTRDGERLGKKILVLGQGEFDLALLRTIRDSGYRGPLGILGHTQDDVEERLRDNLDGLDWLVPQLEGRAPGPKPVPRTKSTTAK
jgi:sugar phosphate isomerase/epimerase